MQKENVPTLTLVIVDMQEDQMGASIFTHQKFVMFYTASKAHVPKDTQSCAGSKISANFKVDVAIAMSKGIPIKKKRLC